MRYIIGVSSDASIVNSFPSTSVKHGVGTFLVIHNSIKHFWAIDSVPSFQDKKPPQSQPAVDIPIEY